MELAGDTQNTLNIVLSVSVVLLTIFLSVVLIYVILILRDVNRIVERTRDTADRVNELVVKPVILISTFVDKIRPIIESALERRAAHHQAEAKRRNKV